MLFWFCADLCRALQLSRDNISPLTHTPRILGSGFRPLRILSVAGKYRPVNTVTGELGLGRVALGVEDVLGCIGVGDRRKDPRRGDPPGSSWVWLIHSGCGRNNSASSFCSAVFYSLFSCFPLTFPSSVPSSLLSWEHSLQRLNHTIKIHFPSRMVVANIDLPTAADSGVWLNI